MARRVTTRIKNKLAPQGGQPRSSDSGAAVTEMLDPRSALLAELRIENEARSRPAARRAKALGWPVGGAALVLLLAFVLPWMRFGPSDATPVDPDEKSAFSRAVRAASAVAWDDFLSRYPNGQFHEEAQKFQALARERADFQWARQQNRIASWARFMRQHPDSAYRSFAEQSWQELRAQQHGQREQQAALDRQAIPAAYSAANRANTAESWRAFLAEHSDNAYSYAAYNNLGALLYGASEFEAALESLQQAARLAPQNPRIQYNLGNTLLALGRIETARQAYEKALQLDPSYAAAQHALEQAIATRFSGRLVWDGQPVAGGEVEVVPDGTVHGSPAVAARSDSDGRFRLPELAPGEYTLRVRAQNGELVLSGSQKVTVRSEWSKLVLELQQEIEPAPPPPDMGGGQSTVLAWTPVAGASRYTVDLYDFGFADGPSQVQSVFQQDVEQPLLRLQRELAPGHEYRWRVRAFRGDNLIGLSRSIILHTRPAGSS